MTEAETELMREAIDWADGCKPKYDHIPKVGAIIAIGRKVIGRVVAGRGAKATTSTPREML